MVVVLAAGAYSTEVIDLQTSLRLSKAKELFDRYSPREIICLGGTEVVGRAGTKTIGELMGIEMVKMGVSRSIISVEDRGGNTFIDLQLIKEELGNSLERRDVVFVTSGFHTLRVQKVLEKLGVNSIVVSASNFEGDAKYPYQRADLAMQVIREYLALTYFQLRGYI